MPGSRAHEPGAGGVKTSCGGHNELHPFYLKPGLLVPRPIRFENVVLRQCGLQRDAVGCGAVGR